jgi:hypothetical protein
MTDATEEPSVGRLEVAVVGGGIAGLTAALALAKKGYGVTVFEQSDRLGGNLSTTEVDGRLYDVYPHMFPGWYANFWRIIEDDLGLKREAHFATQNTIKLRRKGESGFIDLYNPTTLKMLWRNLTSGVLPPADLFLLGFHMLDLAGEPFAGAGLSRRLSVNAHLYSRGYATERAAEFSDYILQLIWSIPSDRTSAPTYQDFVKHTFQFPTPSPFAWMLRGDAETQVMAPWRSRLEDLGCALRTGETVTRVETDGVSATLTLKSGEVIQADSLIMAVPAEPLADLAMTGVEGRRLADHVPELSLAARLRAESIPVVTVTFKTKLPGVPRDIVGLLGTAESLSVVDISQLWDLAPPGHGRTVLVLACSNLYALPALTEHERGWAMIRTLADYLPLFDPGTHWGDANCDVDWLSSRYASNDRRRIHIDQVGDDPGMPNAAYDALPGVYFAGDFCRTDVQMATIEAAVQSGILAAQAVQKRRPRGAPIAMTPHAVRSEAAFLAAKLLLLPTAYVAAAWSHAIDQKANLAAESPPPDPLAPAAEMALLPSAYLKDLSTTVSNLARVLIHPPSSKGDTVSSPPDLAAAAAPLLAVGQQIVEAIHARLNPPSSPGPPIGDNPPRYQRRWRVKT